MSSFRTTAVRAARSAGHELMRHFRHLTTHQVKKKGRHDLVTEADMAANRAIIRTIRRQFPDHDFLSEETGLEDNPGAYRWTIDPLDGTMNFALQSPLFCTAIALLHGTEIRLGVIYAPYMKELYVAEEGKGAWLNGMRLRVSTTRALSDTLVLIGRTHRRQSHENFVRLQHRLEDRVFNVRRLGSGSLELAYTAAGRSDATIFTPPGVSLWDAPAGVLLVQEAGGTVTGFHNKPWTARSTGLVASNGHIHRSLIRAL
ncbi:MAG: inositol monophosphatase family protein [Patescibacteria group bacterium]